MRMTREFYVPKHYETLIKVPGTTLEFYAISDTIGMGFSGKKAKYDFYAQFKTPELMQNHFHDWAKKHFDREEYKKKQKAKKKAAIEEKAKAIKVGDIYYTSWGYEQTNVEFYKVVEIKGKKVTLIEVAEKIAETDGACDYVVPVPEAEIGEPFTRMVGEYGFKIDKCAYATKWNGKPTYQTAWGYGH